jgi:hypothetical protein
MIFKDNHSPAGTGFIFGCKGKGVKGKIRNTGLFVEKKQAGSQIKNKRMRKALFLSLSTSNISLFLAHSKVWN